MDEDAVDLRAIWGTLRRQARVIAATIAIALVAATVVTFLLTPRYSATALVFVDTTQKNLLDPDPASVPSSTADNARVESEVEIVTAIPTLLRVVEDAGLLIDPEFSPRLGLREEAFARLGLGTPGLPTGEEALNAVVDKLASAVSVRRRGLTYLIEIEATAQSPETAARIANATAEAYIALQIQSKTQSILTSLDLLEPRIAQAVEDLAASQSAFDQFIEDNIARIAAEGNDPAIAALRLQLQSVAADRALLGQAIERARASLDILDYDTLARSLQSEALGRLQAERAQLLRRMSEAAPDGGAAATFEASLASIDGEIKAEADREISSLRIRIDAVQAQANQLHEEARRAFLASDLPPPVLAELFELQQNAALATAGYEQLVTRVDALRKEADLQIADSRVVAPATAPSHPSYPNTPLILGVVLLAAAGLGVGAAFVADAFFGGVTAPQQLEGMTRREVAASVPLQKLIWREGAAPASSVADTVVLAPLSHYAEAIRHLRLRLDQALETQTGTSDGKVVLVTSALPVEGKTATALAVARTYALSGQSVMIIDADLRKPALHHHLGVSSGAGLPDYLAGRASPDALKSILTGDPLSGAWAVLNAHRSNEPSEHLITSRNFAALITAARKNHDVVIIDTAPTGVVVDAAYLLRHADAVLFVTRYAQTSQRDVVDALNLLDRSNAQARPVVLAISHQPAKLGSRAGKRRSGYFAEAW